jgi:hypothetical protein
MKTTSALARGGVSALALGVWLAATPVALDLGRGEGGFGITSSKAFAKDGDDDSGGGNSGRGGGDDRGDSGGGGSGRSGGDDDRGGNGGRGGDDRGGDSGGRGDDDDGDDSGRGRGGDGADDRGRGGDDSARRDADIGAGVQNGGDLRVVKFERSADGVEVTYSNGLKEEVESGRYELKNAAGRTVVERPATSQDLARIGRNARASRVAPAASGGNAPSLPARSQAARIEIQGGNIEVSYTTGWREEIEAGRYELKDPANNTVVERGATAADRSRLLGLAGR